MPPVPLLANLSQQAQSRGSLKPPAEGETSAPSEAQPKADAIVVEPSPDSAPPEEAGKPPGLRPFNEVIADTTRLDGLFTLYQNLEGQQAYLALKPDQLNQNYLLLATLESGLGELGLFRGWPISDFMVQFRRSPGNKVQVVVPNLYFRAAPRQPREQQLLSQSFSDSPIATLNIVSVDSASNTVLVDLKDFILGRDPADLVAQFPWVFSSYSLNSDGSYLEPLKAFPKNIEAAAVLSFSGSASSDPFAMLFGPYLESLPDSRGFNLRLRYSFSQLPENSGYRPRPADERVGYFLTAFRSPIQDGSREPFVRYIQRWHLEKQDPTAALSPPRQPVVFWIENTVPQQYRKAVEEGVLMWNEAFERAGFKDAIAVRQMPDNADWDPADTRYNVIRWSDSFGSGVLGYGPSRVNPLTGEILDADVVLDANVIRYLTQEYQTLASPLEASTASYLQLCSRPLQRLYQQWQQTQAAGRAAAPGRLGGLSALLPAASPMAPPAAYGAPDPADRCASLGAAQQVAFGGLALDLLGAPFTQSETLKTYLYDYLKSLTAHEVGHVLGLRHNFLGSTLLAPDQLNDSELTRSQGLVSSVMDYYPPNLAPADIPQGEYFPTRLGPYDLWAIEYGYKPLEGPLAQFDPQALAPIAGQSTSPELAYATDEDIFDFLNPQAAAWDLSSNPLQYAQWQMDNAQALWKKLDWYSLRPGAGYGELRRRFDLVLNYYLNQAQTLTNYIGGQRFTRIDPWSSRGQQPFTPIPVDQQRQALEALERYVLSPTAFDFPPELLNSLAPDRWNHWGQGLTLYPLDYPIYDRILLVQGLALSDVLYSDRLRRLRDGELKAGPEETLTLPELFDRVGTMVWSEVFSGGDQASDLSSLRRGLQRHHLSLLSNLVLRRSFSDLERSQDVLDAVGIFSTIGAPEDARVLARYQLQQIEGAIATTLQRQGNALNLSSRAHLEDVRDRILKTLNAPLQGS